MVENTITTTRKGRFQLAKFIGTRYRFDLDEACFHELAEEREPNRLWYERIPCAQGAFIGVQSVKPLTFKLWTPRVKNAKTIHGAIKGNPGFIKADFGFDGEAEIYFTKEALPTVAELAGARKKRHLSPEVKDRLIEQQIDARKAALRELIPAGEGHAVLPGAKLVEVDHLALAYRGW